MSNSTVEHGSIFGTSRLICSPSPLQNLLRSTENCWENQNLSEIVTRSLACNPDQLKPFCHKVLQPLWAPRPTQTWQQLSQLLFNILSAINLKQLLTDATKRPNFARCA